MAISKQFEIYHSAARRIVFKWGAFETVQIRFKVDHLLLRDLKKKPKVTSSYLQASGSTNKCLQLFCLPCTMFGIWMKCYMYCSVMNTSNSSTFVFKLIYKYFVRYSPLHLFVIIYETVAEHWRRALQMHLSSIPKHQWPYLQQECYPKGLVR